MKGGTKVMTLYDLIWRLIVLLLLKTKKTKNNLCRWGGQLAFFFFR